MNTPTQQTFRAMHFILLMSIVASCNLELGLSLINDSSKDGGRWYHTVYGGSSSCPHRRTSLLRRKTKRSAQAATCTTMVAFSTSAICKPNATVLRRRKCSYVADTDCHYPPARESIINSSRSIPNGNSFFSTLGRANTARCSSSRLAAQRLIDPHSDGGDDSFRRKDGGRIVDPTTQSKALKRQRRVTRPSMKTGAPPNGDDATRTSRLRQRGGERVPGRGTAAAAASAAAATSATGAPGAKAGAGIDQNDPLVKAWNSARVLNPSRDEFPLGGLQQQRNQRQGHHRREDFAGGEKASIPPGRIRAGVRENGRRDASGRGGGRGRGRGRKMMPVGVYRGDDKVPWYIKEVQDKGLDKEGSFEQWWKTNLEPEAVVGSIKHMKVQELKAQLESMGLPTAGLKKAELSEKLAEGLRKFSLSDDNFQHAEVVDTTSQDSGLPNCFPQVYETLSESELEQLWRDSVRRK